QAAAHEEAAFVALQLEAAPVDLELGAFLDAKVDVALHFVELRLRDHRPVVGLRIARRPDLQALDPRDEFVDQNIRGLFAARHAPGARMAAFAGRAVARADQRIDRLIHVGIGHHHHVVLGAAEALHAFAVSAAGGVDVFGDRRGADEADRAYA